MKIAPTLVLFLALIGASILWAQSNQTDPQTIKQLQARLQALEQRVTALENQKQTNYIATPALSLPPGYIATPALPLPPGSKPKGEPFQFNGQTFYLTPLQQGAMDKK